MSLKNLGSRGGANDGRNKSMKVQQTTGQRGHHDIDIDVNANDVNLPQNLPKINAKKGKRPLASVDGHDADDDFDREGKGMLKGRSQPELVKGKDIGKKRIASQNQGISDGRNIQILNRQTSNKPSLPQVSNRSRQSLEEKSKDAYSNAG